MMLMADYLVYMSPMKIALMQSIPHKVGSLNKLLGPLYTVNEALESFFSSSCDRSRFLGGGSPLISSLPFPSRSNSALASVEKEMFVLEGETLLPIDTGTWDNINLTQVQ